MSSVKNGQPDRTNTMSQVLEECRNAATVGHQIASAHQKHLKKTLSIAEDNIRKTLLDFTNSSCYSPEATSMLQGQLTDIQSSFSNLSFAFQEDLENLYSNLSKFTITLFGRTMAGKSTLMEILTEGNGDSIGKGSQRTTRDVRKYTWNNLDITDLPGIGAFDGEEDEQIAFNAAKTADLILFLITDDAPQAIEAEWFSKIMNLGKPIICVVNVKASMAEGKSVRLIARDINKNFNSARLDDIRNQFLKYADSFGQTWSHIPFVYVHLKSAFESQQESNQDYSALFYDLSRIDYLKSRILSLVREKGQFIRIKTFVDIISNPMFASLEQLLTQSQTNSIQGKTIVAKKRQLSNWRQTYYRDSKQQIISLINKISGDLKSEIATFAEDHFSDKDADKAWSNILKKRRIEVRCQELLTSLETAVNDKLKEITREINNELRFTTSFANDNALRMPRIIDSKKIWDWSGIVISGGLSIAAGITYLLGSALSGPLGWAALGVTGFSLIGSLFLKNRNKKELEARLKLEKRLRENVTRLCESLQSQMLKNLDLLVTIRIDSLLKEIDKINSVIFRLADTQRNLAWDINSHLVSLNKDISFEAIRLVAADSIESNILSVARIPGNSVLFLLRDGTVFPTEKRGELYKLMGEQISFAFETDSKRTLISRILGKAIDRNQISIEEKIGIAHITMSTPTPIILNRIRLAQQLSELQIIMQ